MPTHSRGHLLMSLSCLQMCSPKTFLSPPPSLRSLSVQLLHRWTNSVIDSWCCEAPIFHKLQLGVFTQDILATELFHIIYASQPLPYPQQAFRLYDSTLEDILDCHAPLRTIDMRSRPTYPRLDGEYSESHRLAKWLERLCRRVGTDNTREAWMKQQSSNDISQKLLVQSMTRRKINDAIILISATGVQHHTYHKKFVFRC